MCVSGGVCAYPWVSGRAYVQGNHKFIWSWKYKLSSYHKNWYTEFKWIQSNFPSLYNKYFVDRDTDICKTL